MLDSCDLVAFAAVTDLARARTFYQETLGLPLTSENPFGCLFDAHGTRLRVTLVEQRADAPYTVLGWVVGDMAAEIAALTRRGIAFLRFDAMDQDGLGVWTAPGGDKVAWFKDPDGNTLSLTEVTGPG